MSACSMPRQRTILRNLKQETGKIEGVTYEKAI